MNLESPTERTFTRVVHFHDVEKEEALKRAQHYQEQVAFYLANVFANRSAYKFTCAQTHDADRLYEIRKGSAVLTVRTTFGLNTSYNERPPRKFYSFSAVASHRNEVLDTVEKVNDVVEWTARSIGAVVIGGGATLALLLFGGHLAAAHLLTLTFGFGAAVGGVLGQLAGRRIHATAETRLEQKGETTQVEKEWALLTEAVALVFEADAPAKA